MIVGLGQARRRARERRGSWAVERGNTLGRSIRTVVDRMEISFVVVSPGIIDEPWRLSSDANVALRARGGRCGWIFPDDEVSELTDYPWSAPPIGIDGGIPRARATLPRPPRSAGVRTTQVVSVETITSLPFAGGRPGLRTLWACRPARPKETTLPPPLIRKDQCAS
jgi:hypothetical protein